MGTTPLKKDTFRQSLASSFKDKDMRPQAISFIVPHLDEARKKEILEKALELAPGIQSEYLRVQDFCLLVPNLKGQRKEEIIGQVLELASNLKDKDTRPQAFSFVGLYPGGPANEEGMEESLAQELS